MTVFIDGKKYTVIKKIECHIDYDGDGNSNALDRLLLKNEKGDDFILLTDNDFVFYLYQQGKIVKSGIYDILKWEEVLHERAWV